MAAQPLSNSATQPANSSVGRELRPLLEAIARRHPASPASLRERLRGGDRGNWPDEQARADARSEVHSLIDMIADRLEAERETASRAPASAMIVSFKPAAPRSEVAEQIEAVPSPKMEWPPRANDPAFAFVETPANETEPEAQVEEEPAPVYRRTRRVPVWAAMALPFTAVSVVAITTLFASQFAPKDAPTILVDADPGTTPIASATIPVTEPVAAPTEPAPAETTNPVEPAPVAPEIKPVPEAPKVEAPAPPPPVFTPPPPKRPVKIFSAPNISASSAAGSVATLLEVDGVALNKSEKRLLGAALNEQLDGLAAGMEREVTVLGQTLTLTAEGRNQQSQDVEMRVASDVHDLPNSITLISDWFVADGEVALHRGPDHSLASRDRIIPMGAQIQRMAYYLDESGEEWTLVGLHGIAIGYVPSVHITPIEAYNGILGYPYNGHRGYAVTQSVKALTQCQTTSIGTNSGKFIKGKLCRDANGNWGGERLPVSASFGQDPGTVTAELKPLFD
ncbi:MAG: hypothetical protein AAFX02_09050 [Pseudomonadota bacterium]